MRVRACDYATDAHTHTREKEQHDWREQKGVRGRGGADCPHRREPRARLSRQEAARHNADTRTQTHEKRITSITPATSKPESRLPPTLSLAPYTHTHTHTCTSKAGERANNATNRMKYIEKERRAVALRQRAYVSVSMCVCE